jgi:hypothetical protein
MHVKICMIFCCSLMMHLLDANMMRDMAVMMGGQIGGSIANQEITSRFGDMQSALAADQTNINSAMSTFSTAVQEAQKKELTNIFHLFSKAQTNISNLLVQQQAGMTAMDAYLQAALSRQQPQTEYLMNATTYDQYFTLATMYTPQGAVWKNPFPVGNWEYDETSDSFWQMSNVALLDGNNAADQAFNNSIFTEWCTRSSNYEIEGEITLYNVSYPFFAGLIFNKARWISGDESRLQKYRLFGLYGDAKGKLQVCFSEAVIATAATQTTAAVWSYPLAQIIASSGTLATKIDQTLLKNLKLSPVVFHIKIKNSPTKIQYKIWPTTTPEPATFTIIKSKNPDLYLYHGIGCMAPGTLAEFKLLQPSELLFSDTSKASFQAQVQAMVQKKLTAQFAANVDTALVSAGG